MPYLDQMLASGEQPIRRDHQHWFVLVADAFYGFLAIIAALALFFLSQNLTGGVRDVMSIVVPVLLIGGLLYILWEALRWRKPSLPSCAGSSESGARLPPTTWAGPAAPI